MGFDPSRYQPENIKRERTEELKTWLVEWNPGSPQHKAATKEIVRRQEWWNKINFGIAVAAFFVAVLSLFVAFIGLSK